MLLENVQRRETPGLKMIILMDAFDAQLVEEGQKCGVHIQALKDVEVRHLLHTSLDQCFSPCELKSYFLF